MGIKEIGFNLALAGVFIFAIIMFAYNFGDLNNASLNLRNDTYINNYLGDINSSLNTYNSEVNTSQQQFTNDIPSTGALSLIFSSVGSVWKTLVNTPRLIYNLTLGLILNKLLGPEFNIVLNIFSALVVAMIIFYAWKWIRSGDPD